jgi:predicted DNA-binding protein (MmcQ/YjbR family)
MWTRFATIACHFLRRRKSCSGDDALCFKVNGKMFAVVGLDRVRLTFKCHPVVFAELIEREDIHPAPYVGRYKWVMLDRLDALRNDELRDLIRQSYEMVAAKAPKPRTSSKRQASSGKKQGSSAKKLARRRARNKS